MTIVEKTITKLLINQAKHFAEFDEYRRSYIARGLRPVVWHFTDADDFSIKTNYVPGDVASPTNNAEGSQANSESGGLMATNYPEDWEGDYVGDRPHLVALDISDLVPEKDYINPSRLSGMHEIYILSPGKVKILRKYKSNVGLKQAEKIEDYYPKSEEELKDIWDQSQGKTKKRMKQESQTKSALEQLVEVLVSDALA